MSNTSTAEGKSLCAGANPDALYSLGLAALRRGDPAAAIAHLERAVAIAPGHAIAHEALGFGLQRLGRSSEGLAALRRAVDLAPNLAASHNEIGVAHLLRGDAAAALAAFRAALAARPGFAIAQLNAGLALQALGQFEAAQQAVLRAIALKPDLAEAQNALGTLLQQRGRPEEAADAYRRALALRPDFAAAINNLGRALRDLGEIEAAIRHYTQAIALKPDYAEAHWNRALLHLLSGRFAEGWEEQEWRWKVADFPSAARDFAAPLWRGEALAGATILLHAEQGFGDTLQFMRYVPLVAASGGTVILEIQPELMRLAASLEGVTQLVPRGAPLPAFSWHAPLLSLPRAFATTLETIPATIPYLTVPPECPAPWRARIGGDRALKIGLVWAGNPTHTNDLNRSLDLATLAPLLAMTEIRFHSLQLGARTPLPEGIVDLAPGLSDFAESAAALACLDLLITADTSVAHLAGALGLPVWVLLPFAPDWRWLLGRTDSPWYPTMRLYRQEKPGDWAAVVARIGRDLAFRLRDISGALREPAGAAS